MKARSLNTATLDAAARDLAGQFLLPTRHSRTNRKLPVAGRDWAVDTLWRADFKDEHDYLVPRVRAHLGDVARKEFDAAAKERFTPRDQAVFEALLEDKLAIRPNGEKIKGKRGTVQIGTRITGWRAKEIETRRGPRVLLKPVQEILYAGQEDELGLSAQNMNVSAEIALLALDAMLDGLDEGTGAAVIQGRTGAQPADPDAATTGTLLFTLVMTDPAFAAASDQADGTVQAAASTITDDSSADATGTLGYCRVSATNDGATPLDDHIDGEAGTSGADFNFNTLSIVSGATVSMSSYTVTLDQGTTAT